VSISLSGKTALVTGASSGLGARFATVLAAAGATVILTARRKDALDALANQLRAGGGRAETRQLDVTDSASVRAVVEATPGIDILVNNAGISIEKLVTDVTEADYDAVMDTNLKGAWLMAQAVGRQMIARQQGGKIVNISSVLGQMVLSRLSVYAMAKAGVNQMTKALALEWARHDIQVNAIAPGYIKTEINRAFFDTDVGKKMIDRMLRKRVGEPEDLDAALLLLSGPGSRFITGSLLTVDDGQVLKGI